MSHDIREEAVVFSCGAERLPGILSVPRQGADTGVLIVVGGPQYRIGSHRQFVSLARQLARAGVAAFRFDYRGMGDGEGEARSFEAVGEDIRCALECFRSRCPGLSRVVLWGLCDGASAACFFAAQAQGGLAGLMLLNPWVRTEEVQARALVRGYYGRHLLSGEFWLRLLTGRVGVRAALASFASNLRRSGGWRLPGGDMPWQAGVGVALPTRLGRALAAFPGPVLIVLSGRDFTAAEFRQATTDDAALRSATARSGVEWLEVPTADHTFSSSAHKRYVEDATLEWLGRLPATPQARAAATAPACIDDPRISPAVRPAPRPGGRYRPT